MATAAERTFIAAVAAAEGVRQFAEDLGVHESGISAPALRSQPTLRRFSPPTWTTRSTRPASRLGQSGPIPTVRADLGASNRNERAMTSPPRSAF